MHCIHCLFLLYSIIAQVQAGNALIQSTPPCCICSEKRLCKHYRLASREEKKQQLNPVIITSLGYNNHNALPYKGWHAHDRDT